MSSEYPLLHTLTFDTDVCDESCMSPDGTMILLFPGREEKHFKLCDTSNWRITTIDTSLNIITGLEKEFYDIKQKTEDRAAWSLDSSKIAFMDSNGKVVLFHVNTSKWTVMDDNNFKFTKEIRKTPNMKIIWNNENIIVTQGTEYENPYEIKTKIIRLWSVKEKKCIRMFEEKKSSWETNGNVYCTSKMKGYRGNDRNYRLTNTFNLSTGEELFKFETENKNVFCNSPGKSLYGESTYGEVLSHHGTNVLLADGTVRNTKTGELQYTVQNNSIFKTWSPDETVLVAYIWSWSGSGSVDSVIRFLKEGVKVVDVLCTDFSTEYYEDTNDYFPFSEFSEIQFAWNNKSDKVAIQCDTSTYYKCVHIVDLVTGKTHILLRAINQYFVHGGSPRMRTTNAIQWCDTKICYGYQLKKINNIYIWAHQHVSPSRSPSMERDFDAIMQDELEKFKKNLEAKYAHQLTREDKKESVRQARGRPPDPDNPEDRGGPAYPWHAQEAFDRAYHASKKRRPRSRSPSSTRKTRSKSRSKSRQRK